ncbi:SlyX family protein [Nannocystaceae bacterium ST9]
MSDAESRAQALEQRVTELEIAAAFRQRTIEELDDALRRQADQLDRLERTLAKLVAERQGGLDLHADPTLDPEEDDPY